MDLGPYEKEELSDADNNTQVFYFLDSNINLWFEDNKLSEIQWSPVWIDNDNVILAN